MARLRAEAVFVVLVAFVAACGPGARLSALQATLKSVDAAREAFVVWDDATQTRIVDEAPSLDEGRAQLAAHRARREHLVAVFEAAYRTLAAALADPEAEDRRLLMIEALASLWTAYEKVTGSAPPTGRAE